jgi:hypothetical protein
MQVSVCPGCKEEVELASWCALCGYCLGCCTCELDPLAYDDAASRATWVEPTEEWDLSDMEDDRYFWDR